LPGKPLSLCRILLYAAPMQDSFSARPQREPMFNVPRVIALLIGLLLLVQGVRAMLDGYSDFEVLAAGAFVPARLTVGLGLEPASAILKAIANSAGRRSIDFQLAQVFLADGGAHLVTLLSHALLHGDWTHVGVNSIWLLAFGSPVARRFGTLRFLAFFAFCAVGGALAQWLADPQSTQPMVGASGAISGLMGAAMRFMFRDEIRLGPGAERDVLLPRLSLAQSFRNRRVLGFVLAMLAINMLTALGFQIIQPGVGKIAWQAHIGGFVVGVLAFALFDPVPREVDRRG
jgi:membrane associated rhomboid family serine protease